MATFNDDRRILKVAELDENILTCDICTDRFEIPKNLPCGHTFCQNCLEKWAQVKEAKEPTCPKCRKSWKIPTGGIRELPLNYHVSALLDLVSDNNLVISSEMCVRHPDIHLEYYCKTCSIPICSKCTIIEHRVPGHKHEYIDKAARYTRNSMKETLNKVKERIDYYTEKEANMKWVKDKLIHSKEQAVLDVEQHTKELVKKIMKNETKILNTLNEAYRVKERVLDSQIDAISIFKDQAKSSFEYSKNLVEQQTDAGILSVHKKTDGMLAGLLNEKISVDPGVSYHLKYSPDPAFASGPQGTALDNEAVASTSIVKVLQPYKKVTCQLVTCDIHGNEVKQGGAEVTAKVTTEKGKSLAGIITDHHNGTYDISFVPNNKPGQQTLSVFLFGQPVKNSPIKIDPTPPLRLQAVDAIGSKVHKQKLLTKPWGVAVSGLGKIYVAEHGSNTVQVFSPKFQYAGHFSLNCCGKQVRPHSMTFTREDHLVITDLDGKQVCVYYTNGKLLRSFSLPELKPPTAAAVSRDGGSIHVSDSNGACIHTFTPEGTLARTIGRQGHLPGQFNTPHCVAVNSADQIVVSDFWFDRLQVFDGKGTFLFTFGQWGKGQGQLWHPCGVATDQHDNIIVCDWNNHRIQMFSRYGNYIGRVDDPSDGVKWPYTVTIIPGQPLNIIVTESNILENHFKLRVFQVKNGS